MQGFPACAVSPMRSNADMAIRRCTTAAVIWSDCGRLARLACVVRGIGRLLWLDAVTGTVLRVPVAHFGQFCDSGTGLSSRNTRRTIDSSTWTRLSVPVAGFGRFLGFRDRFSCPCSEIRATPRFRDRIVVPEHPSNDRHHYRDKSKIAQNREIPPFFATRPRTAPKHPIRSLSL